MISRLQQRIVISLRPLYDVFGLVPIIVNGKGTSIKQRFFSFEKSKVAAQAQSLHTNRTNQKQAKKKNAIWHVKSPDHTCSHHPQDLQKPAKCLEATSS